MRKMNRNLLIKPAAVLFLALAHQHHLRAAAVTNILSVSLSTIVQGENIRTLGSPVERDLVNKQKLTNKQILSYLATSAGNADVANAGNYIEVVLPDAGTNIVSVKDKSGAVVLDASTYITISFGTEDIFARTLNDDSLQQTRTGYRLITFSFDDQNGKQVQVTGLATDRHTASAIKNGVQHESSTLSSTVSGNGVIDGLPAVANGMILLRGKDILTD
jgi:hypothetical protein